MQKCQLDFPICPSGRVLHGDLCVHAASPAVAQQRSGAAPADARRQETHGGRGRPAAERDRLPGDGALAPPQSSVQVIGESAWTHVNHVLLFISIHCNVPFFTEGTWRAENLKRFHRGRVKRHSSSSVMLVWMYITYMSSTLPRSKTITQNAAFLYEYLKKSVLP